MKKTYVVVATSAEALKAVAQTGQLPKYGCHLTHEDCTVEGWFVVGRAEADIVLLPREELLTQTIAALDEKEKKVRAELEAKLTTLKTMRQELLAISFEAEGKEGV